MSIPSQAYEQNESTAAYRAIEAVEKAPLAERKENAKEYAEACHDPRLIAERMSWLFEGNYGYGHMLRARRILAGSSRMNKVAALSCMLAAVEWHCPGKMAIDAWKKLTPAQKRAVDGAIKREIKHAEKALKENA